MSEELKACPFCGEASNVHLCTTRVTSDQSFSAVECHSCGTTGGHHLKSDVAIAAWNTRAPIERLEAENRQMREALGKWKCDACKGDGKIGVRRNTCPACKGSGAHEIARATLASLPVQP